MFTGRDNNEGYQNKKKKECLINLYMFQYLNMDLVDYTLYVIKNVFCCWETSTELEKKNWGDSSKHKQICLVERL